MGRASHRHATARLISRQRGTGRDAGSRDFPRLVDESDIALQLCTAGNLRTALLTAKLLDKAGQFERLLIATDTPTGSGIMPLGMLYTI